MTISLQMKVLEEESHSHHQMPTIPHLFRCPISLELFTDPVTLSTGQTYDRPSIERWLSSGNLTCPVTMQKLTDLSMVPNCTLSHLIHHWLNQTAGNRPRLVLPDQDRDHDHFLAGLKQTLLESNDEPSWEKKLQALKQVKALSLELTNGENESLIKLGFFPVLINLALKEDTNSSSVQRLELVEVALNSALKMMPFCELEPLNLIIREERKFAYFKALFEQGSCAIKVSLCSLLKTVMLSPETEELSAVIVSSEEILRPVINLVDYPDRDDDDDDEEKESDYDDEGDVATVSEAGVEAILAVCSNVTSHDHDRQERILKKLVEFGAVQALIRCIWRVSRLEGGLAVPQALGAIEVLLKVQGGKEALLGEPNGVKALVKMVFTVSDHRGSEGAVSCLMGLCCESMEAREEAIRVGVLTQLLLLIQSQCSGRTKTKARMLLKLLRSMWASSKDTVGKNGVGCCVKRREEGVGRERG